MTKLLAPFAALAALLPAVAFGAGGTQQPAKPAVTTKQPAKAAKPAAKPAKVVAKVAKPTKAKAAVKAAAATHAAGCAHCATPSTLKAPVEKVSYIIGFSIGTSMSRDSIATADLDLNALTDGMRTALAGAKSVLPEKDMQAAMGQFQQQIMARQAAKTKAQQEKNKKEGDAFLVANKAKAGVVTLPSGLQYKVIKEGTGALPKATDTVSVNYRGTLIGGKEFDSSYKRGEPAQFAANQVIPGWTEALQLMKVGSKWQLFVPAKLAYGERGAGQDIGPNSTLIFEVELLAIQPPAEPEKPAEGDGAAKPAEGADAAKPAEGAAK